MSEFELKRMIKLNEVTFKVVASADGRYHELCFLKIPKAEFLSVFFQLRNNMGVTVSSLISLCHTCSFHDTIICIV